MARPLSTPVRDPRPFEKTGGALPRRPGIESLSFGLPGSLGLVGDELDREAHGGTHERGNNSPDHVVDAVNTGGSMKDSQLKTPRPPDMYTTAPEMPMMRPPTAEPMLALMKAFLSGRATP